MFILACVQVHLMNSSSKNEPNIIYVHFADKKKIVKGKTVFQMFD